MTSDQAVRFVQAFRGDDWYVSLEAAVEAVRRRGMFNVIHVPSGLKADILVSRGTAHDSARFSRVRKILMPDGREDPFASPEDVILKKLKFFRDGGSSNHFRDIHSMIAGQGVETLDRCYLKTWAAELRVVAQLDQVKLRV